jgi:hypothetical protein
MPEYEATVDTACDVLKANLVGNLFLKGQCYEILGVRFFHESVSVLEQFAAQGAPPVSLTPVKNRKNH